MGRRQLVGDDDVLRVITQNRMIMGCFRHGSLESRIGCAKCGNIGSIEKRLLIYKGDKNRECFADIAKPAMIEFAAHPDCPALSATASARRAKKMKLQPRFNALASILQGLFIADSARRYVRRRLGGAETVPNLVSFGGICAKSLRIQIRKPNPPQSLYSFPLFPAVSRSQTHISNINAMHRAKIAPLPDI